KKALGAISVLSADNKKALEAISVLSVDNKKTLEAINTLSTDNKEILEAINLFSTETDKRFSGIDVRLDKVENTMVTKYYLNDKLDEKLADLRGDLVVLVRKEDSKMKKLVDILKKRDLLNDTEFNEIMSMEPFPQLAL
ncbi:hypothetical protein KAI65_02560, partial [Candidatus Parcubacteria bacterium]|nr:hypothetical protein [Candidatus Parcubacteria bacterium]